MTIQQSIQEETIEDMSPIQVLSPPTGGGSNASTEPIQEETKVVVPPMVYMSPPNGGGDVPTEPIQEETITSLSPRTGMSPSDDGRGLASLVEDIIETHRNRQDFHRAEKGMTNRIKARCRRLVDGDKPESEVLYKAMLSIGKTKHDKAGAALVANVDFLEARGVIERPRKKAEKKMEQLARVLPLARFIEDTPGLGALSVASLIGETGMLSNYSTVAKLWKRLGLAVMPDGTRQRLVPGVAALEHGYNPSRRSVMWNVGNNVFRTQSARKGGEAGPYRVVYDDRKAYELERNPDIRPIIAHRRATRYMEKRIVRDLWRAWRDAA